MSGLGLFFREIGKRATRGSLARAELAAQGVVLATARRDGRGWAHGARHAPGGPDVRPEAQSARDVRVRRARGVSRGVLPGDARGSRSRAADARAPASGAPRRRRNGRGRRVVGGVATRARCGHAPRARDARARGTRRGYGVFVVVGVRLRVATEGAPRGGGGQAPQQAVLAARLSGGGFNRAE